MFYHLLFPLRDHFFGFNVLRYITFRSAGAALLSLVLTITLGPWIIKRLQQAKVGDTVREFPLFEQQHKAKVGTPTMGGLLIVLTLVISTALWARLDNSFIHAALICTVFLGLVGFLDDYLKLKKGKPGGLKPWQKLTAQAFIGTAVGVFLYMSPETAGFSDVTVPFFKDALIRLGILYVPFAALVIMFSSNAVNLTDGLDGLAIGGVVITAATMGLFAYFTGNFKFSQYLLIPFVQQSSELTVYLSAMMGAGLGFLWFNSFPSQVFMGDTGALALGGAIGLVALLVRKEILLLIVGGIFLVEIVSVILQVTCFKLTGKRIFKMTPLHHHFELKGWPEPKVVVRFWIINIILALVTFSTLKLR